MTEVPTDDQERLNSPEQIAPIDEVREQALKFAAAQLKLSAEQLKFRAEQLKLSARSQKRDRDRRLAPWRAMSGLVGGILTILVTAARGLKSIP